MKRFLQVAIGFLLVGCVQLAYTGENVAEIPVKEAYQQQGNSNGGVDILAAVTRGMFRTMEIGGIFGFGIINSASSNSVFPLLAAILPSMVVNFGVGAFDSIFQINEETKLYSDTMIAKPLSLSMLSIATLIACGILVQDYVHA